MKYLLYLFIVMVPFAAFGNEEDKNLFCISGLDLQIGQDQAEILEIYNKAVFDKNGPQKDNPDMMDFTGPLGEIPFEFGTVNSGITFHFDKQNRLAGFRMSYMCECDRANIPLEKIREAFLEKIKEIHKCHEGQSLNYSGENSEFTYKFYELDMPINFIYRLDVMAKSNTRD